MVILIADDEAGVRSSLNQTLKKNHEVIVCEDGSVALEVLKKTSVDLVITDHQMPQLSGLELIRQGKELFPNTAFVLMTAFGSIQQAVEAIRIGADDYVTKPFDLAEIRHRVQRIENLRTWNIETALKEESAYGFSRLIGKSPAMKKTTEFIAKVGSAPYPVLLLGPSGSGKEVVAKAIHESSPRAAHPFIAINCASLSEQLMESELFGHEKGAFTGANSSKPGKFELANGGTLFLDEVGELPLALQAKLLRVLQECEFYRLGGVRQIKTDARVIAATNRRLSEMIKSGQFREDLFFRLNVLAHELPALCERGEDIPVLIDYFWGKLTREMGRKVSLSPEALEKLYRYSYPGNIRELQNTLERLLVLGPGSGMISPTSLPPEFEPPLRSGTQTPPLKENWEGQGLDHVLEDVEKRVLSEAMEQCGHNQVKAARLLKLTRSNLQYRLKKHGYQRVAKFAGEQDDKDAA